MPQMNPAAARLVDPVLTTVARGYRNENYVGMNLFPFVPVPQRGGKVVTFDKNAWRQYQLARTPGSTVKRINVGYSGNPYSLTQHALEGQVPIELQDEAQTVPGIDLANTTVLTTQDIIALRLEAEQAALATNAANYGANNKITLVGTDQWSDYSNLAASNPLDDIDTAIEAIRAKTGMRPNQITMGPKVFKALKRHPGLINTALANGLIVGNGNEVQSGLTRAQLAAIFDVANVDVGDAIALNDSDVPFDVWGKSVVVAYTRTATLAARGTPSYGYTYRLQAYPVAEQPYYERQSKSWIYPLTDEVQPVIAGADAGYLISDAVA